jgi:signal transduction histidine kinase
MMNKKIQGLDISESAESDPKKLNKIISALMGQVERSMDGQGNAYSMFQAATVLEDKVKDRTAELTELNAKLHKEIAEREIVESELRVAREASEQANRSKTQFLAAAGHDLLQPLNAAKLFISTLLDRNLPNGERSLVERSDHALNSVEGLLETLLDISKLDAGAIEPNVSNFKISTILQALELEFSTLSEQAGLDIRFVPCSLAIRTDPILLERILRNFLSNALRYTERGRILVGCKLRGAELSIEVYDTGAGIADDQIVSIFEEFKRLPTSPMIEREGMSPGMGLGLSIVKRIARILDHKVSVQSQTNSGSTFAIQVPITQEPSDVEAPISAQNYSSPMKISKNVLVIDDDTDVRAGMKVLLTGWGCSVKTVPALEPAMEYLASQSVIDTVIADFHLGENSSGIDVIQALREKTGHQLPAILITADRHENLRSRAAELNISFLNKPVRPAKLRALLQYQPDVID